MKRYMLALGVVVLAGAAHAQPAQRPPSFAACAVCHATQAGARSTIGPNLWGVGQRTAGTLPGYAFSPAMKSSNIRWTAEELNAYLANPRAKVPGNKMVAGQVTDATKRSAIVDYLLSLR